MFSSFITFTAAIKVVAMQIVISTPTKNQSRGLHLLIPTSEAPFEEVLRSEIITSAKNSIHTDQSFLVGQIFFYVATIAWSYFS